MAGKSKIEWTEATWNPIVGCSILTPGCTNCYAMKMAARIEMMKRSHYDGTTKKVKGNAVWTGKLALAPDHILLEPLKRKKPTTYFVNSMGDLFHEDCPDEWIDKVVAVMSMCPHHTFQVLTKRAERMRAYSTDREHVIGHIVAAQDMVHAGLVKGPAEIQIAWPLPNVWLGVSAERQQEADERIPHLLQTPAAVRFVSAEPLLGEIALGEFLIPPDIAARHGAPTINWLIVGGESGPNARPMHPDWARSLRDQCNAAGVAHFFKQWGSWYPIIDRDDDPDWRADYTRSSRHPEKYRIVNLAGGFGFHGERVHLMQRYSKAASGRLLDGREHNDMPQPRNLTEKQLPSCAPQVGLSQS
jgi:protein gp37